MKKEKYYNGIISFVMAVALSLSVAAPTVFADYTGIEFTNASGQTEPAVLVKNNNNGSAVGWAGDFGPIELYQYLIPKDLNIQELPDVTGIICTNVNSPENNIIYYEPQSVRIRGEVIPCASITELPWEPQSYLISAVFLPMDINDDNIIVGNVLCLYMNCSGQVKVAAIPFIAEGPQGIPTLVLSVDENDVICPMPVSNGDMLNAFATGINNAGDIVGTMVGVFNIEDSLCLSQGFIFNKSDIDDDGLLDASEMKTVDCGRSFQTFLLSINNSGMMTGAYFSMEYPMANGSNLLDGNGNNLLSDEDAPIPAGVDNLPDIISNLLKVKYITMNGFVKSLNAADDDYITINNVSTWDMSHDQTAGEAEIYGTVPYTILDTGDVLLAYTEIDPGDAVEDEMCTLNDYLDALLNSDSQYNLTDLFSIQTGYLCSAPYYNNTALVSQGNHFPDADKTVITDIDSSGTAVGGYMTGSSVLYAYTSTGQPVGTINQAVLVYTWDSDSSALSYELCIQNQSKKSIFKLWYPAATVDNNNGTCSVCPGNVLVPGVYYWLVRVKNDLGVIGPWSARTAFTVTGPVGTINQAVPVYTWGSDSSALSYELCIQNQAKKSIFKLWYPAATVDNNNGTCSVCPGYDLVPGDYYWLVRVKNDLGVIGPWSARTAFTVDTDQVAPEAPTLNTPTGIIGPDSPVFDWNSVANADAYELCLQNQFQNSIFKKGYAATIVDNDDGTCTINPVKYLVPGDYYWLVRARNQYGEGPWSTKISFTVVAQ